MHSQCSLLTRLYLSSIMWTLVMAKKEPMSRSEVVPSVLCSIFTITNSSQENLDLFLANAQCQHIFLAACRDSGFARMLEPYRYHTIASKITLVANGYIAPDIARLGWWTTTWPDVFGERANRTPLAEQKKRAAIAQVEQARCRQLGLVGIVNERLAQSILEVVRPVVKVSGRGFESFGLGVDLMSKALKGMPSEASPGIVKLVDDID